MLTNYIHTSSYIDTHRTEYRAPVEGEIANSEITEITDVADTEFVLGVLHAPPGGGKSTTFLSEVAITPGLYLIAVPRIELAEEHAAWLHGKVKGTKPLKRPIIVVIHSEQPEKGDVDRRVVGALDDYAGKHAIIITTHAALMALAPGEVEGCHIRIDETPETGVVSGVVGLAASWPSLAARYDLVPSPEKGWSRLVPRRGVEALGIMQVRRDVGAGLVDVHRIARSRGRIVEIDLASWEDAAVPDRPPVRWRSIWSLAELRGCASLQIAAAGYDNSLIGHATKRAGGMRAKIIDVGSPRTGQPKIRIHYYTKHTGSTAWWDEDDGGRCMFAIARHLERLGFQGYFATNKSNRKLFYGLWDTAVPISPRNAGTNALRHHTACAILYSCKATDADAALIAAFGIDREDIRAAREDEDIFQTVTRGAIRCPDYAGDYDIHVYDRGQAERLRDRLATTGYTDITLVAEAGVGIMDVVRPDGRRRKTTDVVETAAERAKRLRDSEAERGRRRREKQREAKKAAGSYRGPGKPKRSASTACVNHNDDITSMEIIPSKNRKKAA